jgi:3'(2'), 5'-bisphosphate nucleotidase
VNAGEEIKLIREISRISVDAGRAILNVYEKDFEVQTKEDSSPLTQADLASHELISAALDRLTPGIPQLSEESDDIPYETRRKWTEYWLIDPLDGTREFVNRNGEFTVNIALIRDHDPVLGAVHVPVRDVTYSGGEISGAARQDGFLDPVPIHVRTPFATPLVVVGSRSHANPVLQKHLQAMGKYELVSMGSSLKFCLVAEGRADFYPRLGPTSEWDTAAAHAVVSAAGGQVITLDGEPLRYNRKDSVLNPEFMVTGDSAIPWRESFSGYRPD